MSSPLKSIKEIGLFTQYAYGLIERYFEDLGSGDVQDPRNGVRNRAPKSLAVSARLFKLSQTTKLLCSSLPA